MISFFFFWGNCTSRWPIWRKMVGAQEDLHTRNVEKWKSNKRHRIQSRDGPEKPVRAEPRQSWAEVKTEAPYARANRLSGRRTFGSFRQNIKDFPGSVFVTFSLLDDLKAAAERIIGNMCIWWYIHINEEALVASLEAIKPQFLIQQFCDSSAGMNLLFICFLSGNTASPSANPQWF